MISSRKLLPTTQDARPDRPLTVVIAPDLQLPVEAFLSQLTPEEQKRVEAQPNERGRRHFVFGRWAAHVAIRSILEAEANPVIEVLTGRNGEPLARVDGIADRVAVSISHSSQLAAACAWHVEPGSCYSVGIDLEWKRLTGLAQSTFAFTRLERRWLARYREDQALAGLTAWTVKEAVWKALRPEQSTSPAEVEIHDLNLVSGQAVVATRGRLLKGSRTIVVQARVSTVDGPNGPYFLAIAEVAPRESRRGKLASKIISPSLNINTTPVVVPSIAPGLRGNAYDPAA